MKEEFGPPQLPSEYFIERFWSFVHAEGEHWMWRGRVNKMGSGYFRIHRRNTTVQRISWWIHHGYWPRRKFVMRSCDMPLCLNPEHLYLGWPVHLRGTVLLGEDSPCAKLTNDDVRYIREVSLTAWSVHDLAEVFKVTPNYIYFIRSNKTRKEG